MPLWKRVGGAQVLKEIFKYTGKLSYIYLKVKTDELFFGSQTH